MVRMPCSNRRCHRGRRATSLEHQAPTPPTTALPPVTLSMDSLLALRASLLLAILTLAGTLEEMDHTLTNMTLAPPMNSLTPGGSAAEPSTTSGPNGSSLTYFGDMPPNSSPWQPTRDHSGPSRRPNERSTITGQSSGHSVPIDRNSSTTSPPTNTSLGRHTRHQRTSHDARRRRRTRRSDQQ